MKKKRFLINILAVLTIFIAIVLSGCVSAPVSSSYIFNGDGSGTAEFTVYVFHDGYTGPGYFGLEPVSDNDKFFPKGYNAALDYLAIKAPDGHKYSYEDKGDYHIVRIKVKFSSVQDLNAKYKEAARENYVEEYKVWSEAEIISDDEYNLTIGVPYEFGKGIISWMSRTLLENPEVFAADRDNDGNITNGIIHNSYVTTNWEGMFGKFDIKIKLGDREKKFYDIFDKLPVNYGEQAREHKVTSKFNGKPPETVSIAGETKDPELSVNNPGTSDTVFVIILFNAMTLFIGAVVYIRKRAK